MFFRNTPESNLDLVNYSHGNFEAKALAAKL